MGPAADEEVENKDNPESRQSESSWKEELITIPYSLIQFKLTVLMKELSNGNLRGIEHQGSHVIEKLVCSRWRAEITPGLILKCIITLNKGS